MNTCHVSSDITFFLTNYTHLFSAQSESIDTSLSHAIVLIVAGGDFATSSPTNDYRGT